MTLRSTFLVILAASHAWFAGSHARAAELSRPLAAIAGVGAEGAGHQEAIAAWKVVVAADPAQLGEILAALDTANPLAANWLHAAIDAIAERALDSNDASTAARLESFLRDVKHTPRARRLAFDWLCRFEPTASDRLVPTFVDDPSTELRREAISRLMDDAATAARGDELAAASALYQQAFTAARDLDQIKTCQEELKKLGVTVDLPRHFGFIVTWKLIGPFDNTAGVGFDKVYPPEESIDPTAKHDGKKGQVAWIDHTTTDEYGMVDLNTALGKENGAAAYAVAEFLSPTDQPVDIRVGCICACKVWLNGQLIDSHEAYHSGTQVDQYIAKGTLTPGRNTIMVKVCQNEMTEAWAQDWQFQLRVCDEIGTAVLSQDRLPGDR